MIDLDELKKAIDCAPKWAKHWCTDMTYPYSNPEINHKINSIELTAQALEQAEKIERLERDLSIIISAAELANIPALTELCKTIKKGA